MVTIPGGSSGPGLADDAELAGAAAALAAGEVVAIPTDTVYGLAADCRSEAASSALFALKGRPPELALPVLVAEPAAALALAAAESHAGLLALSQACWPGPLTVVVPISAGTRLVLGGDGETVGLRCPGHRLARRLLAMTGPLAVTSANRHGEPPCTTAAGVRRAFAGERLLVLDGGTCDGEPSSVVSLAVSPPVLLRRGPVGVAELTAVLGLEVLAP